MFNKRGQVTIFVIIAVIIVAGVAGYFLVRGGFETQVVSANLAPVYNAFLSCVEENTLTGVSILESEGGYIELPEFEPGSSVIPFSSQLNFLGTPIPYWYYVSGNNIQEQQVPSKSLMEDQLADYVESQINDCVLEEYFEQGFAISVGEDVEADISIGREEIGVNLDVDFGIEKAEEVALVRDHTLTVNSKLGALYEAAREIYQYEQDTLFLENYGIDTLRLYAPVDGVELTCGPIIWNANDVFEDIKVAIEANTMALRSRGTDTDLTKEENKYFILDLPVDQDVRFLNSKNWSYSYEVNPSEGPIMTAKPMGNQPGMAALGFCYVPYHFVYNINYPVLVQVYEDEEVFQFPMAVVIRGNKPREALNFTTSALPEPEICSYMNTPVSVGTYDNYLNPISASVSFECFEKRCPIGQSSENGILEELFPQCANGFVIAEAEGFKTTKEYFSTSSSDYVDIILDRLYEKQVSLKIDGKSYDGDAIITITSNDSSASLLYPKQNTVKLSQGQYEFQVYVYRNSSIKLEETKQQQCMDVPSGGLGGLFGLTDTECFEILIPEQTISQALHAGGQQTYFVSDSELEYATTIDINTDSLPLPKTIEELQNNFVLFEEQSLDILLI